MRKLSLGVLPWVVAVAMQVTHFPGDPLFGYFAWMTAVVISLGLVLSSGWGGNYFTRLKYQGVVVLLTALLGAAIFGGAYWLLIMRAPKPPAPRVATEANTALRPWIAAEVIPGAVVFDARGAQVFFAVRSINTGRSPATHVTVRAKVINSQGPDIQGEQRSLCPPIQDQPNFAGADIFQGQELTERFGLLIGPEEMDRSKLFQGWQDTDLLLTIVACVDYVVTGSNEHHQSYAAGLISSRDSGRGTIVRGVDVPVDRIEYRAINHGLASN